VREEPVIDPPATPEAGPAPAGSGSRASLAAFLLGFLSMLTLLLVRNSALFSTVVHERGDYAANSILAGQAKDFDLLVGNYSRLGFSHPGPAFLYCQAFGEWLFHDVLSIVPSPWNGQWLALLILGSALVALTLTLVGSWVGYGPRLVVAAAAALLFLAVHGQVLSWPWMPYLYCAPFLLLLTAAASVAAGRTAHLWALALAGGLLVHGHAEFLLFVPAIAGYALAVLWYRYRRAGRRGPPAGARRHWLWFGVVAAVFGFPILLNLVLNWPGEFGKYLSYGGDRHSHGAAATIGYLLRFWAERPVTAVAFAAVLFGGVGLLARWSPAGPVRRFLAAGLGVAALATLLFAGYAARGIDDLTQDYVGFFHRSVPLFLLLLLAAGLTEPGRLPRPARLPRRHRSRPAWALALAALVVAAGMAGGSPSLAAPVDSLPESEPALAALVDHAAGRPVLVDLEHASWPDMTALLVEGDRAGRRVCVRDPGWRFMVTSEFVCTGAELAEGCPVRLGARPPAGVAVLARIGGSLVWAERPAPAAGAATRR
jgi:hypothetical protein